MKTLVATKEGQGVRSNDFSFTREGEIVYLGWTCDRDVKSPDGGCGCGRSFSGTESHKATTTAKIEERPMTVDDLDGILRASLTEAGWLPGFEESSPGLVRDMAEELADIAGDFRIGDVIEKRGDRIRVRGVV